MRKIAIALLVLAACDKPPAANPPVKPPPMSGTPAASTPPPAADVPKVDPNSPLTGGDLMALGFPKDVNVADFGSNAQAKKFMVHAEKHPLRLNYELHLCATEAEAEEKYKLRKEGRAGGTPDLKEENKYGSKSYVSLMAAEIVFVKGKNLGVVAGADPEREAKPGELEKLLRGAAERLAK